MTVAIAAALFFGGKYAPAQAPLADHPSIAAPLNASRFSRRVHRIKALFLTLFALLGAHWTHLNAEAV